MSARLSCEFRVPAASWLVSVIAAVVLGAVCHEANAGSFDLWGIEGSYKATMGYSAARRMEEQEEALINGPVDPLVPVLLPPMRPGQNQLIGFEHTGLPTTINFDDGNRNFDKGSLINNRLSLYTELQLRRDNYGLVLSGDAFRDEAYLGKNDNDSPETVNKTGPHNEFTAQTEKRSGKRARLLEAYVYGDWELFDGAAFLNLRVGEHVVAWGESLFFSGMALAQGRADATRAFVAGAEIKEILLPTNQVSLQLAASPELTLLGYYKLEFAPTEIFGNGHYFSPSDIVGPGSSFAYGSINPAALDGCPGLLNFPPLPDLSPLCNLGGIGMPLLNAPATINVERREDITPDDSGQWGIGLNYQLTVGTSVGLYRLNFHDPNPSVKLDQGFAFIGSVAGVPITTGIVNQYVPVGYHIQYFDDIKMTAASISTTVGPFNVGGELSYREGLPMMVQTIQSGVLAPVFVRGNLSQLLVSSIYAVNPKFFYDDLAVVTELGYIYVNDVDKVQEEPGLLPVGEGDELFNDKTSWGYQILALAKKRNIVDGWDFLSTFSTAEIVSGNPSMSGAFGSLFGEGDQRVSLGVGLQYLQNLEFGVSYNWFLGDPDIGIRDSIVKQNPYVDRDYLTFNIKYNL
jgi:hypothetical protein